MCNTFLINGTDFLVHVIVLFFIIPSFNTVQACDDDLHVTTNCGGKLWKSCISLSLFLSSFCLFERFLIQMSGSFFLETWDFSFTEMILLHLCLMSWNNYLVVINMVIVEIWTIEICIPKFSLFRREAKQWWRGEKFPTPQNKQ